MDTSFTAHIVRNDSMETEAWQFEQRVNIVARNAQSFSARASLESCQLAFGAVWKVAVVMVCSAKTTRRVLVGCQRSCAGCWCVCTSLRCEDLQTHALVRTFVNCKSSVANMMRLILLATLCAASQ